MQVSNTNKRLLAALQQQKVKTTTKWIFADVWALLEQSKVLKELDLSGGNKIGAEGAKLLAEALERNSTLTTLDLGGNEIGAEGAKRLAEALERNSTLTTLDISCGLFGDNDIGSEGAKRLAEALERNSSLTTLVLSDNSVGAEGAGRLAGALERNSTLTTLNLASNKIGNEGAKRLAEALERNSTLTTLNLSGGLLRGNSIGDEGAKRLAEALERNSTLTTLDISCGLFGGGNKIRDEGAKRLAEALERNRTLTTLNLFGNGVHANAQINAFLARNKANPPAKQDGTSVVPKIVGNWLREQPGNKACVVKNINADQLQEARHVLHQQNVRSVHLEAVGDGLWLIGSATDINRAEKILADAAATNTHLKPDFAKPVATPAPIISVVPAAQLSPLPITTVEYSEELMGKVLGAGGFGEVYRGALHGTPVAVKKLRFAIGELDDEMRRDFEHESRCLMMLRHPHVVTLIGIALDPEQIPLLVFEYMEGGSLDHQLYRKKAKLTPEIKKQLTLEIARGLAYLHTRKPPVLHRDIKSANVLVDTECKHARLGDLGLARIKDTSRSLRTIAGTPVYMAPEILREESYNLPADVYSFGLVVFEIYTSTRPYPIKWGTSELKEHVGKGNYRPEIPADVPEYAKKIISLCWQKTAAARPTMLDVIKMLELQ